jgi:hypothetical protein
MPHVPVRGTVDKGAKQSGGVLSKVQPTKLPNPVRIPKPATQNSAK